MPKKATQIQLAKYGLVAAAIRQAMEAKNMKASALNDALGNSRSNASIYLWLNAQSAPSPQSRPQVAKVLGLTVEALTPKTLDQHNSESKALVVRAPRTPKFMQSVNTSDVLGFTSTGDGQARVKMDFVCATEQAINIIQMLSTLGVGKQSRK